MSEVMNKSGELLGGMRPARSAERTRFCTQYVRALGDVRIVASMSDIGARVFATGWSALR